MSLREIIPFPDQVVLCEQCQDRRRIVAIDQKILRIMVRQAFDMLRVRYE
jgi:hypothetical protein